MALTCSECGKKFHPWRECMFENYQTTCGSADCQRARKTRMQQERRAKQRPAGDSVMTQRGSTLPQNAPPKQRRPTLLQVRQGRSTLPQKSGVA